MYNYYKIKGYTDSKLKAKVRLLKGKITKNNTTFCLFPYNNTKFLLIMNNTNLNGVFS